MKKYHIYILLIFLIFCGSCSKESTDFEKIIILYTNDEHGWMEGSEGYSGAAGLSELWKTWEGYDGSENYLILSGGDMWTGPAISTWFDGESMVEVMNTLEYDAAALGNHEFDFTVEVLKQRVRQMDFPMLSANIIDKGTGEIPSFVKPYVVINAGAINVGIIGLSSLSTPYSSFPKYVENYEFTEYGEAIKTYAPQAIADGAEMLIVIGHICSYEMTPIASLAALNGVSLIAGGHCHEVLAEELAGVLMIESGARMNNYVKVEYEIDSDTRDAFLKRVQVVQNNSEELDPEVQSIVAGWKSEADEILSEKIGYCSERIGQSSVEMGNMVADSWFYTFPDADITMTNSGGIRQDIESGDITIETIVGLLPFNNTIYELNLSGSEVIDVSGNLLVGGMTTIGGYYLSDGTPIQPR